MVNTTIDTCTACGWISAIISCISFGSFAVPIKSEVARQCNVDPLVWQSYKTFMCLVTAIITPKLFGQDYYFTPYGIVSGIFWVPAGVAAVYSVQNAGLALSQGLWSSIIVLVSFVWGIFVFREGVRSKEVASLAVFIMCLGLWGMSFFSSSIGASASVSVNDGNLYQAQQQEQCLERNNDRNNDGDFCSEVATDSDGDENGTNERNAAVNSNDRSSSLGYEGLVNHSADTTYCSTSLGHDRHDDGILNAAEEIDTFRDDDEEGNDGDNDDNICHDSNLQYSQHEIIRRRRMGMAAAVFNGVWGGSIMVPMQFAPPEASGIGYVVSFAIGASIVTILLWILRFCHGWYKNDGHSMMHAYNSLPPLHLKIMWAPGGLAGTLWSIGNIASMVSVQNLGEGVGYSVTQASMLCSGLWGIFYFNEIVSRDMRIKWFASAIITVAGILLLSHEHEG